MGAKVSLHGRAFGFDAEGGGFFGRAYGYEGAVIGALQKKTVTSAQVLALFATPITIIAAPAAGYANIVKRVAISKAAGTAYAGIAVGEDLVFKYTSAAGAQVSSVIETTGFLDSAAAQVRYAYPPASAGATAGDITPVAAAVVVLHLLVGEITTGNSDLIVWVWYDVMPTVLTV